MATDVGYGGASGEEIGSFLVFLPMRVDGSGIVSQWAPSYWLRSSPGGVERRPSHWRLPLLRTKPVGVGNAQLASASPFGTDMVFGLESAVCLVLCFRLRAGLVGLVNSLAFWA